MHSKVDRPRRGQLAGRNAVMHTVYAYGICIRYMHTVYAYGICRAIIDPNAAAAKFTYLHGGLVYTIYKE